MRIFSAALAAIAVACLAVSADAREARTVVHEVTVAAPVASAWRDWTTVEGLRTIFVTPAPLRANVDLRAGGPYEMLFLADRGPDEKGSEGSVVLAFEPERMLSFTWRNTPHWPALRPYFTHVVITFEPVGDNATRIRLVQSGFGEGEAWGNTHRYFTDAWGTVLGRQVANYQR